MSELRKLNLNEKPLTIGMLPSSYLISLTAEEQNLIIGKKIDEIICFINNLFQDKLSTIIQNYVNKEFNNIMLNSMYIAETETLVLYLENKEE